MNKFVMMMKIVMVMVIVYHCKNGGVAADDEGEGPETSNSVKSKVNQQF